jgi:phage FluMu protein Com
MAPAMRIICKNQGCNSVLRADTTLGPMPGEPYLEGGRGETFLKCPHCGHVNELDEQTRTEGDPRQTLGSKMDRQKLLSQAPTSQQLLVGSDSRRKELAEKYIAAVLDALEADNSEPDVWEAMYLNLAIGDIIMRKYLFSIDKTTRALTSPNERAELLRQPAKKRSLRDLRHFLLTRGWPS